MLKANVCMHNALCKQATLSVAYEDSLSTLCIMAIGSLIHKTDIILIFIDNRIISKDIS